MKVIVPILLLLYLSTPTFAISLQEYNQLKKNQAFDFKDKKFDRVLLRGQYYRLRYLSNNRMRKEYFTKNLLLMEYISLLRLCRYQLADQLLSEISQLVKILAIDKNILSEFESKRKAVRELNILSPSKDHINPKNTNNVQTCLKWKVSNIKIKNLDLTKLESLHFEIENKCKQF